MENMDMTTGVLISLVIGAVYFFPMGIAFYRDHHSKAAITAVNVIFGWTFLGWIFAFIWALTGVRKDRV